MKVNAVQNPLISIVIPIYNIETYAPKCIESVLAQSYRNLEIILINDGSTDSSGEICDKYAQEDSRVIVIHKPNGGLSDARNAGIRKASGELLTCIDGDDHVSPKYVETLLFPFNNQEVDLSIIGFKKVLPNFTPPITQGNRQNPKIETLPQEVALERLFLQNGVTTSAWGKLYRREAFKGIEYPLARSYEDLPVTYRLFAKAKCIAIIQQEAYFYVQHSKSITSTTAFHKRTHTIGFAEEAVDFARRELPTLVPAAQVRAFMESIFIISQVPSIKTLKALDCSVVECLKRNRKAIFRVKSNYKHKIYCIASYFGIPVLWVAVKTAVLISGKKIRSNSV